MIKRNDLCPCGSKNLYSSCCQPFLDIGSPPDTAELLMRSRYTAYVLQYEKYLLKTWHNRTRPQSLDFQNNPVVWLGLEILGNKAGLALDSTGTVHFLTKYLESGMLCNLEENSQFVKENGDWYYLSGKCSLTKDKLKRNIPCPCGSEIKFKKCCMNT